MTKDVNGLVCILLVVLAGLVFAIYQLLKGNND